MIVVRYNYSELCFKKCIQLKHHNNNLRIVMFIALIIIFMPVMILPMEFAHDEIKKASSEIIKNEEKKQGITFCSIDKLQDLAAQAYFIKWNGKHLDLFENLPQLPREVASRIANQKNQFGNTLLHTFAYLGDTKKVKYLLDLNVDKNPRNKWYETPLLVAAQQGCIAVCRLLYIYHIIETDVYNDLQDYICRIPGDDAINFEKEFFDSKIQPLIVAAERDDDYTKQQLLDIEHLPYSKDTASLITNKRYYCGNTYLHTAAYLGDAKLVQYLLDLGFDKQTANIWKETPLLVAAKQGHIAICRLLYNRVEMKSYGIRLFQEYVFSMPGDDARNFAKEYFKERLENELDCFNKIAIRVLRCDIDFIKQSLELEISPVDDEVLMNGIKSGSLHIVSLLLNRKNLQHNDHVLYLATLHGNSRIAHIMVEHEIKCSDVLHYASRYNNKKLVKLYLKKFPEQLNSVDLGGRKTPLFYACVHGNLALVKKFLRLGAQVNIVGEYNTALYAAVIYKHYQIVKILLKKNAQFNSHEIQGVITIKNADPVMDDLLAKQKQIQDFTDSSQISNDTIKNGEQNL